MTATRSETWPATWRSASTSTATATCSASGFSSALRFVPYKDRRAVAADLKKIYTAADRDAAWDKLEAFAETWDAKYPTISAAWTEH